MFPDTEDPILHYMGRLRKVKQYLRRFPFNHIITVLKPHAKTRMAGKRFDRYYSGMTVLEYLQRMDTEFGYNYAKTTRDMLWDIDHGFIYVGPEVISTSNTSPDGSSSDPQSTPPGSPPRFPDGSPPRYTNRGRKTAELIAELEMRGDRRSLDIISELANTSKDEGIRLSAAATLAAYQYSKQATTPVPRYIDHPVKLSMPTSPEEATAQINELGNLLALGKLDLDFHNALLASRRAYIEVMRSGEDLDIKRLKANDPGINATINITGGLPPLPGSNIIMPHPGDVMGEPLRLDDSTPVTNGHGPADSATQGPDSAAPDDSPPESTSEPPPGNAPS